MGCRRPSITVKIRKQMRKLKQNTSVFLHTAGLGLYTPEKEISFVTMAQVILLHPGHGTFEPWGKGHFPSMEESEQLQIWRDKNFQKTMSAVCNKQHKTAAGAKNHLSSKSTPIFTFI